jgi:hypothetical protein
VCGTLADGCGGTLDCGSCGVCQTCNSAGQRVADPSQNRTTCAGSAGATSVCCNGECCAGCCDGAGACGACRTFVTSTGYDGQLDGLSGADAKCLARAAAVNLPGATITGNYKAWLSDSTDSPSTRFRCTQASCSTQGYVLVDGATVVANDWADLTTCDPGNGACLAHAINYTELGFRNHGETNVWTHTNTDGTAGGVGNVHCQNWSTNAHDQSGDFAIPAAGFRPDGTGDVTWTRYGAEPCGPFAVFGIQLYCFQQS